MSAVIAGAAFVDGSATPPTQYARELRRADPFIRYGVCTVHGLLEQLDEYSTPTEECALCLGSEFGPMDTNFDVLDQVVTGQQTSPTLFSHSVFNAAAGYLSRIFKLHGPALTITDFCFPFFQAMQQALLSLDCGHSRSCLVVHVESYSELLHHARQHHPGGAAPPWNGGGAALLLVRDTDLRDRPVLTNLQVEPQTVPPETHLESAGEMRWRREVTMLSSPLDVSKHFCEAVGQIGPGEERITIAGRCGTVRISLSVP